MNITQFETNTHIFKKDTISGIDGCWRLCLKINDNPLSGETDIGIRMLNRHEVDMIEALLLEVKKQYGK